jgi:hypothetical protein
MSIPGFVAHTFTALHRSTFQAEVLTSIIKVKGGPTVEIIEVRSVTQQLTAAQTNSNTNNTSINATANTTALFAQRRLVESFAEVQYQVSGLTETQASKAILDINSVAGDPAAFTSSLGTAFMRAGAAVPAGFGVIGTRAAIKTDAPTTAPTATPTSAAPTTAPTTGVTASPNTQPTSQPTSVPTLHCNAINAATSKDLILATCTPGYYKENSECCECPTGYFGTTTRCDRCPTGKYQTQTRQTKCKVCPIDADCADGELKKNADYEFSVLNARDTSYTVLVHCTHTLYSYR